APISAEAIPAICPIGSIASAFRLPNSKPKQKKITAAYDINNHSGTAIKNCANNSSAELVEKHTSAVMQIERGPKRRTKRELNKEASPRVNARAPKYKAKVSPTE